jgi:DNA-binding LacI/PurR family transcriptional regulator
MRSREWIERELRERIRRGLYAPGSRMPSHRELLDQLGASSATLQKAFDRLEEQGYVEPRGARGTFVARALPHTSHLALVFPEEPDIGQWNRFWTTGKRVAEEWRGAVRFRPYHIAGQRPDSPGHGQLCRDHEDGGFAGIVFITSPHYLRGSPLFAQPIPRVVISGNGRRDSERFGASVVEMMDDGILEAVLRRCAASGRRRVAAITARGMQDAVAEECRPVLRALGMETRPEWWLGQHVAAPAAECARGVARLLLAGPERSRPDCLLITDDNLVPHVTAGVLDVGVEVPRELAIAAHANFPGPTHAAVPCLRFGPDMEQLLRAAADEIAALAAGGIPRVVQVPVGLREEA